MTQKRRTRLSDQLRRFIQTGELSCYEISKQTGIDTSTLSRFLHKKGGLSVDGLDKIADCLGLNLVQEGRPRKAKG